MEKISKELVQQYEFIRQAGEFNMVVDYEDVMKKMKMNPRHKKDRDVYWTIIDNYDSLMKKYNIERT